MSKPKHSKRLNTLVSKAKVLFNQKCGRSNYVRSELAPKPTVKEQSEIDEVLRQMNSLTSCMGIDSTPTEKYNYRLECGKLMTRIKLIHEGFYWSIQIQDEV